MVRSMFPTIFADESTELTIAAVRTLTLRKSFRARVRRLRLATWSQLWPSLRRVRTRMLAQDLRADFQFLKAQHEKWSSLVNASFADRRAALHALDVTVTAARARHWVRPLQAKNGCGATAVMPGSR